MNVQPANHPRRESLTFRISLIFLAMLVLSATIIVSSFTLSKNTSGDARVINDSGSLRMMSYQMASLLSSGDPHLDEKLNKIINNFDQILINKKEFIEQQSQNKQLLIQYQLISFQWHENIKPSLKAGEVKAYLKSVNKFVSQVDRLVHLLEKNTERKINQFSAIIFSCLVVLFFLMFFIIHFMKSNIAEPLSTLVATAKEIGNKNFSIRAPTGSHDELGLLATTMNTMSEELSKLYSDLEARVEEKTFQLQQSNNSLNLLYNTTKNLSGGISKLQSHFPEVLTNLKSVAGLESAALCLLDEENSQSYQFFSSAGETQSNLCDSKPFENDGQIIAGEMQVIEIGEHKLARIRVEAASSLYGYLLLKSDISHQFDDQLSSLAMAFADIIANSLGAAVKAEQESKLLLMEERAVIARELHDSLAQSLSYQKLQVARIRKLFERNFDQETIYSSLEDLKEGLNTAYRQLRDLLTTFRLKPQYGNLQENIEAAVEEFAERGKLSVNLNYSLDHCPLRAHEEIHLQQIIREGLANIVQHAKATVADVQLIHHPEKNIEIIISDNGIGIPASPKKTGHFGMIILRERAQKLDGELSIDRNEHGGTTVRLTFRPDFMQKDNSNE